MYPVRWIAAWSSARDIVPRCSRIPMTRWRKARPCRGRGSDTAGGRGAHPGGGGRRPCARGTRGQRRSWMLPSSPRSSRRAAQRRASSSSNVASSARTLSRLTCITTRRSLPRRVARRRAITSCFPVSPNPPAGMVAPRCGLTYGWARSPMRTQRGLVILAPPSDTQTLLCAYLGAESVPIRRQGQPTRRSWGWGIRLGSVGWAGGWRVDAS